MPGGSIKTLGNDEAQDRDIQQGNKQKKVKLTQRLKIKNDTRAFLF